jgi:hypothetical protein
MRRFAHTLAPVSTLSGLGDSLTHSDYDVVDGETVWVLSERCEYVYRRGSGLVPDGINVVASVFGDGVWVRMEFSTDTSWLQQAAWFVNSVTGSDQNSGATSGTPIKTWAELRRRVGSGSFSQATTITLQRALPPTDPMIVDFGGTAAVTIVGTTTLVLNTQPLAGSGPRNPSANLMASMSDGVTNFGGFGLQNVLMRNGTDSAWLVGNSGGGIIALTSSWLTVAGAEVPPPAHGAVVSLLTPCVVGKAYIAPRLSMGGGLTLVDLEFPTSPPVVLAGCSRGVPVTFRTCEFLTTLFGELSTCTFVNCAFTGALCRQCTWTISGGTNRGLGTTMQFSSASAVDLRLGFVGSVAAGGGVVADTGSFLRIEDAASFNTGLGVGVTLTTGARGIAAILWGSQTGLVPGCLIGVSSQLEGTTANNRYITGGSGDVQIGTIAPGPWPAVANTLTADPASLAAFMHD